MAQSAGSRIFRVVLTLVGAVLLFVGYAFWSMPKPEGARVEVSSKIVGVLSPDMYAWIIRTPNGAALVDSGLDPTGKALLAELNAQGISAEKVHSVFLTHGHGDHTAGAILFKNAKVYAGGKDIPLVRGNEKPVKLARLFTALIGLPAVPADIQPLQGGETIDADGVPVKVISVPGHTDGSMAFLVGDVLFTGDSLMGSGEKVFVLPGFSSKDEDENKKSLEKLVDLPFSVVADGHAGATVNAREKVKRLLRK